MTINYNVTGEKRKALVHDIEALTGVKAVYMKMPTQAYEIGPYTVSKTGALSFSGDTDAEYLIEQLLEKGYEGDVELPEDTPNGKVDAVGIAMPRKLFTDSQLENIRRLMKAKASLIKKAMGTNDLPILDDGEKVSFPWWHNDVGADEVHAFTNFICKLKETAGNQKRVTSKKTAPDNEKYAFRCFLLKLGFIGDEYKQDRKILLRNFEGSAAFKSGKRKEHAPGCAPIPTPENTVSFDVEEAKARLQDPAVQEEIKAILNGGDAEWTDSRIDRLWSDCGSNSNPA